MSAPIAIWDWKREPQPPSARVVLCRPGLDSPPGSARWDWTWDTMFERDGQYFVLPYDPARLPRPLPSHIIPALYAEDNAGLAGIGDLISVNADRRALVLCPREGMDLAHSLWVTTGTLPQAGAHYPANGYAYPKTGPNRRGRLVGGKRQCVKVDTHLGACTAEPAVYDNRKSSLDLVVIIPPPEARACPEVGAPTDPSRHYCCKRPCGGPGAPNCWTCSRCNGTGRIDPWPMHTDWVRGIVEQCCAAGVAVVFLGWGEWCPISDTWPPPPNGTEERSVWRGAEGDPNDLPLLFYRVGTERAGRTLNDDEVMDLPEWLT